MPVGYSNFNLPIGAERSCQEPVLNRPGNELNPKSWTQPWRFCSNPGRFTSQTSDLTKTLTLSMYRITPLGMQVLSLNPMPAPEPYVRAIAEAIKAQGFEASVASCVPIPGQPGKFHFFNASKV